MVNNRWKELFVQFWINSFFFRKTLEYSQKTRWLISDSALSGRFKSQHTIISTATSGHRKNIFSKTYKVHIFFNFGISVGKSEEVGTMGRFVKFYIFSTLLTTFLIATL